MSSSPSHDEFTLEELDQIGASRFATKHYHLLTHDYIPTENNAPARDPGPQETPIVWTEANPEPQPSLERMEKDARLAALDRERAEKVQMARLELARREERCWCCGARGGFVIKRVCGVKGEIKAEIKAAAWCEAAGISGSAGVQRYRREMGPDGVLGWVDVLDTDVMEPEVGRDCFATILCWFCVELKSMKDREGNRLCRFASCVDCPSEIGGEKLSPKKMEGLKKAVEEVRKEREPCVLREYYKAHHEVEAQHMFQKMNFIPQKDFPVRPTQCPCCKEPITESEDIWQCSHRLVEVDEKGKSKFSQCKTIKCEKNCVRSHKQEEHSKLLGIWMENVQRDRATFLNEEPLPVVTCAKESIPGKNRWCLPESLEIPAVQTCNYLEWKSKRNNLEREDFVKSFGTVLQTYSAEGTPFSLSDTMSTRSSLCDDSDELEDENMA